MRFENIDLQTHHKRTARLLPSLCALDVYLQMCLIAWMAASPPVEHLPKIGDTLPTAAKNSILSASRLQGYDFFCQRLHSPCLTVWNFQNAENVRVESVNRHRAYFPLVRLFQTLKNAAKV